MSRRIRCICCPAQRVGVSFCRSCGLAYDRAHRSAVVSSVADALAWVARRAVAKYKAHGDAAKRAGKVAR